MQQCRHEGVILGFDFGTVRLGVAVGNGLVREARPLAILDSRTVKARWASIERVMTTLAKQFEQRCGAQIRA